MLKSQSEFLNRYVERNNSGIGPKRATTLAQSIPKSPVYHYPVYLDKVGPEPTDLIINAITNNSGELAIAVTHVTKLPVEPKDTMFAKRLSTEDKLIKDYYKKQRQFTRVFDIDATLRKNYPLIVNYQMLPELYPVRLHNQDTYRWVENQWWKAIWDNIRNIKTDRMQFISVFTPRTLKPMDWYMQMLRNPRLGELRKLRSREDLILLDLIGWYTGLSENTVIGTHLKSIFPSLFMTAEAKSQSRDATAGEPAIIIMLRDDINVIYLDLRQLAEWSLEAGDASSKLRWIYSLFASHVDNRIVIEDTVEETYHEEIVRVKDEVRKEEPAVIVKGVADAVLDEADTLLASGAISESEYKANIKLASRYTKLTDPYSGEPLTRTILKARTASIDVPPSTVPDIGVIEDKSYLDNTVKELDRDYITNHLDNDIINTIMQLPNEGIIVTNIKREEKRDAVTHNVILTVQTKPIKGDIATLKIVYPKPQPDGTMLSGGVKYRMNKQRSEKPIIKIAPDTTALASAMGKIFVRRGFMAVDNVLGWWVKQLNLGEESGLITDTLRANVAVTGMEYDIPEIYSAMSSRFTSFTSCGIKFNWDYTKRGTTFKLTPAELKTAEKKGIVCGKKGANLIVCGDGDLFYDHTGKLLGTLEDILGLDADKKPIEWAGVKIKGKVIPVGALLAYWLGIEKFFKYIGVKVTEYEGNTRIPNVNGIVIRFKDIKLVVEYTDKLQELLVAGFKYLKVGLRGVNYEDLNKKMNFPSVLGTRGINNSQIKEYTRIERNWIDPITYKLLVQQKEPTNIHQLFIRSVELLTTRQYIDESDGAVKVNRGYDRINDIIYRELMRGVRDLNTGSVTAKRTFTINPKAVNLAIITDEGVSPVGQTNPYQVTGEQDRITYSGANGRSNRTLVAKHRKFSENDLGIISEGFTDNGKAGTILYYTNNPNISSVYGTVDSDGEKDLGNLVSSAALLSPFSMHDD